MIKRLMREDGKLLAAAAILAAGAIVAARILSLLHLPV